MRTRDPRRAGARLASALLAAPLVAALAACTAPGGAPGPVPIAAAPGTAAAPVATQPMGAAAGQTIGTGIVFFTEDSAFLDAPAQAIVAESASLAGAHPWARVRVRGFTGPAGSPGFNAALAETRARNVADALRERGVPRERIALEARPQVPFELIPTESRRVEVVVGG